MVNVRLNDHRDEFGIFVRRSFLQVHQNLVMALLMYRSRIVGIWHDRLDQSCAAHARTIESNMKMKQITINDIVTLCIRLWVTGHEKLPESNLLDIYGIPCLLSSLRCQHLVNRISIIPILVR